MIKLIEDNKIIENGAIKNIDLNDSLKHEIRSIDRYLDNNFCSDKAKEYFASKNVNIKDSSFIKLFNEFNSASTFNNSAWYYEMRSNSIEYDCANYEKMIMLTGRQLEADTNNFNFNGEKFKLSSFNNSFIITIDGANKIRKEINLNDYAPLFEKNVVIGEKKEIHIQNNEWMSIYTESDKYRFKLYCASLSQNSETKEIITYSNIVLLIGKK